MTQDRTNSFKPFVAIVALSSSLILRSEALAQGWPCPFRTPGIGGMGGFLGWFGGIFTIVFWILIAVGIVRLIQWLGSQSRISQQQQPAAAIETPFDILKRRYARGEISKEQYQAMRRDLE